jgi:ubiquinol-cytochrome c reductase cytochrome b subunit
MFSAILIILTMTFGDLAKLRGIQFKPLNKTMFFIFVGNLLLLMVLGAKHVESPFIEIGQIATLVYFSYFVVTVPMSTIFENSINEFYTQVKGKLSRFYNSTK